MVFLSLLTPERIGTELKKEIVNKKDNFEHQQLSLEIIFNKNVLEGLMIYASPNG